jgi:hypothetical protein
MWILELKEGEIAKLNKEDRDLAFNIGYIIIGFPTAIILLCGAVLEWGDVMLALKFFIVFFAVLIPFSQICILPLVTILYLYNRFIKKDLSTSASSSEFWMQLSVLGLVLILVSVWTAGETEKDTLPHLNTLLTHQRAFYLSTVINFSVGLIWRLMVIARSKLLILLTLIQFSAPVICYAILLEMLGRLSVTENLLTGILAGATIITAMLVASEIVLRAFGYSLDQLESAVKSSNTMKSPIFWLLWTNAAIAGLGVLIVQLSQEMLLSIFLILAVLLLLLRIRR